MIKYGLLSTIFVASYVSVANAQTVVSSTWLDDYQSDTQGSKGWYIYDDITGDKGNPLVVSPQTGNIYHGPTKRDTNQGYYMRKFQCSTMSSLSWSADVFYCSPSSSTSNSVQTLLNNVNHGNPFGWVKMGTGIPYHDQALIDATGCINWEYKKIYEPNSDMDSGIAPEVDGGEEFTFRFKFRLIGGRDYAAVSNFRIECRPNVQGMLNLLANELSADISAMDAKLQIVQTNADVSREDISNLRDRVGMAEQEISSTKHDVENLNSTIKTKSAKSERDITMMNAAVADVQAMVQISQVNARSLEKKTKKNIANLESRVRTAQNVIDATEVKIETLNRTIHTKVQTLESDITKVNRTVFEVESEVDVVVADFNRWVNESEETLAAIGARVDAAQAASGANEETIEALTNTIQAKLRAIAADIADVNATAFALEFKVESIDSDFAGLEKTLVRTIQDDIADLSYRMDATGEVANTTQQTVETFVSTRESAEESVSELAATVAKNLNDVSAVKANLTSLSAQVAAHESDIATLNNSIGAMNARVAAVEARGLVCNTYTRSSASNEVLSCGDATEILVDCYSTARLRMRSENGEDFCAGPGELKAICCKVA